MSESVLAVAALGLLACLAVVLEWWSRRRWLRRVTATPWKTQHERPEHYWNALGVEQWPT